MRVLGILVTLVTIIPAVFSISIPVPEDLCKPSSQPCPNNLPTEICDNIGEERCLGNEWRLECSIEHRWKAFEECPQSGVCGALDNKTYCSTEISPTPPSPPSPPQPEACVEVDDVRCAKWSNGLHRIDVCDYDLFWVSYKTCRPEEFCMYWVPGKELSSGHAICTFISDVPPTGPRLKNLDTRSQMSQGTPDALEHCNIVGETRCSGKQIETCGTYNSWSKIESCGDKEECFAEHHHARCQPIVASTLFTLPSPVASPQWCKTGESRCLGDVLQQCEENSWTSTMCPKPSTCVKHDDVAQCWVEPPSPPTVPEPCVPGDRRCDSDAYALQLCGKDGMYHTEKKCATPGDCKTDGPGQAHCQTGSMDAPKFKRQTNSTHCTHGDYACDTHRRFLYTCKDGRWEEPIQCSRAGACQPVEPTPEYPKGTMDCVGFPKYLYPDNRVCETVSSCEFMRYMYCSAGSTKPEDKEKCRASMCQDWDCKDCDRCTYHLGYGEVLQPDLNTLIHGSPTL